MKCAIFAASLLLFALPAHAQKRANVAGGASPAAAPTYSGGGAGGGGGSMGFGSGFLPTTNRTAFQMTSAQGSSTFVPSTFVPYKEAVKMGQAALAYKPKSIAEVAAEYRASKKRAN